MENIKAIVEAQNAFFRENKTKDVAFRIKMLQRLKLAIQQQEEELYQALYQDLSKSRAEAYMAEISLVYGEIEDAIKHVPGWSRPKRVKGTFATFPSKSTLYMEPYGVVLILAPWNYPVLLTLSPLVGAIAAGNCAVVKCSKSSKHTAEVLRTIIHTAFQKEYCYCVDAEMDYDEVVDQEYQYIFFTGSPNVGKKIMATASKRLIPVSLELGGKSPCIITDSANLKMAARRVAWGKFLNAGQTCISVDYILVDHKVKDEFVACLKEEIQKNYKDAEVSKEYPKIINEHHFKRLQALLSTNDMVWGGAVNEEEQKIAPAIMEQASFEDEIMKEEIFGPILPMIEYVNLDDAIRRIKQRPKPLACYIFSENRNTSKRLLYEISFGGGCVNDVIMHIANPHLPFGGVGNSGMGGYHGRYSFETFSHKKSVITSSTGIDIPLRYPPFNEKKWKFFKKIL